MPKLEVEKNHTMGLKLKDKAVQLVSQLKWLVQCEKDELRKYTVEGVEEEDEGEGDGCDACYDDSHLDYCNMTRATLGKRDESKNDSWCAKCGICACFYTCDCPEEHVLCKHIHKVHSFKLKMMMKQEKQAKLNKSKTEESSAPSDLVALEK